MVKPAKDLEDIIGHSFTNKALLETALTHSSTGEEYSYERLEFLGDRVLGLVIASLLFRDFPNEKEGDMAKRLAYLVQGQTLADLSSRLSLADFIIFSEAEAAAGGAENEHILADVFEAIIGALYLDAGLEPCRVLIETHWADVLHTMKKPPQHPKTALQEWAQGEGLQLPIYDIIGQDGPDHAPVFKIRLSVSGHNEVIATGRSRAEAEKNAAQEFVSGIEL